MDDKTQIQLGSEENINSVTVDTYTKVELSNKTTELMEYDIRNILSVTEVFEIERQESETYRIYGGLEYFAILNGIKKEYKYVSDFFLYHNCDLNSTNACPYKNVVDSFNFYLVKPSTGNTKITSNITTYVRNYEVVATPADFDIFNAGYSRNVYNETKFSYAFNEDFNVAGIVDAFGFPLTELYLYALYSPETNGFGTPELMESTVWSTTTGAKDEIAFNPIPLNIGDTVYGDKINYFKETFSQTTIDEQTYYIACDLWDNASRRLRFKYNPFIPFQLRYFSDELKRANTGSTAYDQAVAIPYYATDLDDGNMIWRNILPQGYVDPLSGNGVDYPFVNKRRYLFSNVILGVVPDLDDSYTAQVFVELNFVDPTTINYSPTGDIDNIGKPCQ